MDFTKPTYFQFLKALSLYSQSEYNMIRCGKAHDGGYVILLLDTYDLFISGGIANDDSFEHLFLKMYPSVYCEAYDGTVSGIPNPNPRINFKSLNIGPINSPHLTNLHLSLEKYSNIFLKMDIEGSEFEWLSSLDKVQKLKFSQIVLEIHGNKDNPYAFTSSQLLVLENLKESHDLVHAHANNHSILRHLQYLEHEDLEVPNVIELTYVRKDLLKLKPSLNTSPLPLKIDHRCHPHIPELKVSKPPLVFKPV